MALLTQYWYFDMLIILLSVLPIIYIYLTSTYGYWRERNVPHDKPSLFFGNFWDAFVFNKSISQYFHYYYNKTTQPYFGLYIFQRPFLLIRDPKLVKAILVKDFNHFVPRTNPPSIPDDSIGTYSIFTIKNSIDWKYLRVKLSPAFSSGKMKQMFILMVEIGEQLNQYIKNLIDTSSDGTHVIEVKECSGKYTTDIISSCAFGVQSNSLIDEHAEFRKASRNLFTYTYWRGLETICIFFSPLLTWLLGFKLFSDSGTAFFHNVLGNVIREREKLNIKRPDLMDALVKLKNVGSIDDNDVEQQETHSTLKFDIEILVAQAAVFFAAGFETTSSAIAFTLHFLSYHPHVQDKLRKEILTVLEANNRNLNYDVVQYMKYLDMCIKETLRMYTSLGYLDRECEKPYTLPDTDLQLEKGVGVIISLYGLHRDPEYFPEPDVYNPERFSDENKSKIIPGTYLPFGEGPRNCIGERFGILTTKVGLVYILKDFEIVTSTKPKPLEINTKAFLTSTNGGIKLKFKQGRTLSEYTY